MNSRLRRIFRESARSGKGIQWRWVLKSAFWPTVVLLILLLLLFRGRSPTLEEWRALIEIGAILTAGVWTYYLFVRERQDYPLTRSEHEIIHLRLDDDRTLLRACVTLHNTGRVLVPLRTAEIFVRQIRPFPDRLVQALEDAWKTGSEGEVAKQIREGRLEELFLLDEGPVKWIEIGYRQLKWEVGKVELEPGEIEQFCADFILLSEPETVEVVSAVENVREDTPYGWVKRTIYDLEVRDDGEETGRKEA